MTAQTGAASSASCESSPADSTDLMGVALALQFDAETDLAAAIDALTRAHQSLNVRLSDAPH